jgi:hypothetical protein
LSSTTTTASRPQDIATVVPLIIGHDLSSCGVDLFFPFPPLMNEGIQSAYLLSRAIVAAVVAAIAIKVDKI